MEIPALTNQRRSTLVLVLTGVVCLGIYSPAAENPVRTIVFFGDSLTAGYGLDPSEAYPALIQNRLRDQGLPYEVINAGLSGETSAAGVRRVDWILQRPCDIFVLALGGNDGLRGIPLAETERNLQAIIDKVREKNPATAIILVGIQALPNMGPDFSEGFRAIFPRLAEANHLRFLPFLLEGVGGIPELNQGDGIHPNVAGQKIVADNVWAVLEPVVRGSSEPG